MREEEKNYRTVAHRVSFLTISSYLIGLLVKWYLRAVTD